jgi:hypothetical protein
MDEQSQKTGDYDRCDPCSVGLVGQGLNEHIITDVLHLVAPVAASSNKMTSGVIYDVVHRLYEGIFILPKCRASWYT